MHKLKNKHTGEPIATPYMAEVEEYLNSGDYELMKSFEDNNAQWLVDDLPIAFPHAEKVERKPFDITPEIAAKRKAQLDKEDF